MGLPRSVKDAVPLPPSPGKPGGLGQKIEDTLVRFLTRTIVAVSDLIFETLKRAGEELLEKIEPEAIEILRPLLEAIEREPTMPEEVRHMARDALQQRRVAWAALLPILGGAALGLAVGAVMGPLFGKLQLEINQRVHPQRPAPGESWQLFWRGFISAATAREWGEELGYPPEAAVGFEELQRPRAPVGDLMNAWLRGIRPEGEVREELRKRGYTDQDIDSFFRLAEVIPPVGDLIRFMVRDVFNEEIVRQWGYDRDFPTAVLQWTRQQGLSDFWTRAYWRAHWDLPSPTQAIEMVHRGGLSIDEFKTLLRIADMAPRFIEPFVRIIYRPYNRVDVRRMYRAGVLDEDGVYRAYRELGYDDEKARHLTAFTIAEYGEESKDATKSEIVRGYKAGLLERNEALQHLLDIGLRRDVAELELALADYQIDIDHVQKVERALRRLYVHDRISQSEAARELTALNIPGHMISRIFEEWEWERRARVATPSRSDLGRWYREGIIDDDEFIAGMRALGYDEKAISRYKAELDARISAEERREAERARKEKEEEERRGAEREYWARVAELNEQIAEDRAKIADIKLAIFMTEDPEVKEQLAQLILELRSEIAHLQLEKARLRRPR